MDEEIMNDEKVPVNMSTLYDMQLEVMVPIITGLLYPGVVILAGPPKVGKSYLVLQIAYDVSQGLQCLGHEVAQSTVLYLALEDSLTRVRNRLYKQFGDNASDNLYIQTSCPRVSEGFVAWLHGFIQMHPNTRLVIVDTLQMIRDPAHKSNYAADYAFIEILKGLARSCGLCILLVHHTRKMPAANPMEMIAGSQGLTGAVDTSMIMLKDTDDNNVLYVTGRDVPDQRLWLRRDPDTNAWIVHHVDHDFDQDLEDPTIKVIADWANKVGNWQGTTTDMIAETGITLPPNVLSRRLNVWRDVLLIKYHILCKRTRTGDHRLWHISVVGQS